jgi:hypothetical protein
MAKETKAENLAEMSQEELVILATDLTDNNKELTAANEKLTAKTAAQAEIIDDMGAQLEVLSKKEPAAKKATVNVDKLEYAIVIKSFKHDGIIVTADDIQNNKKLAKELVEMGSGALQLIEK